MKTDELIAWARENCPEPLAAEQSPFEEAKAEYDAVDERLGDDAESDPFLRKILWMETTIRLARLGWSVETFENERWPVQNMKKLGRLILDM